MKVFVVLSLCVFGAASAWEFIKATGENLQFAHQSVFDWMKVLTNQEIYALIAQKEVQWPTYDVIPPPSFDCAQKSFPGFYADPATQCQTFHRCDINGNLTSYICVNRTVFNPITLICDQWFNVDCAAFIKDEYFANRRLYTSLPLFGGASQSKGPNGEWVYVQEGASVPKFAVAAAPSIPAPVPAAREAVDADEAADVGALSAQEQNQNQDAAPVEDAASA